MSGENSAETFYSLMVKSWPGHSITDDAKYSLATEFINFGQQKINLFLSGKGMIQIQYLENEFKRTERFSSEDTVAAVNDSSKTTLYDVDDHFRKMKTLASSSYDVAAEMMEKAIMILNEDEELLGPIYPKLYFLKAMALYNDRHIKTQVALDYGRKAIRLDSTAAYNYVLLGWIFAAIQNDSCEYYFNRAARIAPRWAIPVNGLGNYYSDIGEKQKAIQYYKKAIELDSAFSTAYSNIGASYQNQHIPDSAILYYQKALKIDPQNKYANGNMGSLLIDSVAKEYRTGKDVTGIYKLAEMYLLKTIQNDGGYSWAYKRLSDLYMVKKEVDKALQVLMNNSTINPENASAYRYLGDFYSGNVADTLIAERYYSKALETDSLDVENYFALGNFYIKYGWLEKADILYQGKGSLKVKYNTEKNTDHGVYGSDYSDIIVNNYTPHYVDIYVDGNYRGTLSPFSTKVTWAIPGYTTLYAKASFNDGSYLYWQPKAVSIGYEYKWDIR